MPATRLLAVRAARRNYQKSSKKTEKPSAAGVFLQFWRGAIDTCSRALKLIRSRVYTEPMREGGRDGGSEMKKRERWGRRRLRDDVVRLYDAYFPRMVDGRM